MQPGRLRLGRGPQGGIRGAVLGRRLGRDQVREPRRGLWQGAEGGQVGLDLTGAHQVDAGEQRPAGVQQRLQFAGAFVQPPLGAGEAPVVVGVVAGEDARGQGGEFGVDGTGVHDQRRGELFQDVAVAPQQQPRELAQVVGDQVALDAVAVVGGGAGLLRLLQAQQGGRREQVGAAQVDVGVAGGEAVQVGAGDGGEDQRVRLVGEERGEVGQGQARRAECFGPGHRHRAPSQRAPSASSSSRCSTWSVQSAGQAAAPRRAPAKAPAMQAIESESPAVQAPRRRAVRGSSGKSR